MTRKFNVVQLCIVSLVLSVQAVLVLASGLPVEHESARLMLAVDAAIEAQDWDHAGQQLGQLQGLEVELPDDYYFYQGLVLSKQARFQEAQKHLEKYVVLTGSKGKHYTAALKLITQVEEGASAADMPVQEPLAPEISGANGDGYIRSLQALYLTEDPVHALIMQINSLLSSHSYHGSRIKKQNERAGVVYSIDARERELVLQEKSYVDGQATLKVVKLNVLGIDPFLRSECSVEELACWIHDPVAQHQRWIVIDRDELVVKELSDALSRLIVRLQR